MKAKLIPALILSFAMVAGAVTINDAYAQTNTERLMTVDDNVNTLIETTSGTNDMITALNSAIDSMSSSIMEMLMSISNAISGVDANVSTVNENVNSLAGDVSSVADSVSGVSSDVSALNTKVDSIASGLSITLSNVASTDGLEHIHEAIDGQSDVLDDISESMISVNDVSNVVNDANVANSAELARIADGVASNAAKLNQLETILNNMQVEADRVAEEVIMMEAVPDPITNLYSDELSYTVKLRNFGDPAAGKLAQKNDEISTYEATFAFTCDENVFLNEATTNVKPNDMKFTGLDQGSGNGDKASLYVGNAALYESAIAKDINNHPVSLDRDSYDFGSMTLEAGDTLEFTAKTTRDHTDYIDKYVDASIGGNITWIRTSNDDTVNAPNNFQKEYPDFGIVKHDNGTIIKTNGKTEFTLERSTFGNTKFFDIGISWFSGSNEPNCRLMQAGDFADLVKTETGILNVMIDGDDDDLIYPFDTKLNCNSAPTMINSIRTEVPGGITLPQYSTLALSTGESDEDDYKTYATFRFLSNGTLVLNNGNLPFTFGGEGELNIEGRLAQKSNMLVVIDYTTSEVNSCSKSE